MPILHGADGIFQRTRFLQSRHLAVTTSVENRARHCEEGETAKSPAVLHYLTPWLEPLPVGSSQFLFLPLWHSALGQLRSAASLFDLIISRDFLIGRYVLRPSR